MQVLSNSTAKCPPQRNSNPRVEADGCKDVHCRTVLNRDKSATAYLSLSRGTRKRIHGALFTYWRTTQQSKWIYISMHVSNYITYMNQKSQKPQLLPLSFHYAKFKNTYNRGMQFTSKYICSQDGQIFRGTVSSTPGTGHLWAGTAVEMRKRGEALTGSRFLFLKKKEQELKQTGSAFTSWRWVLCAFSAHFLVFIHSTNIQ